jgi:hypothetical protein
MNTNTKLAADAIIPYLTAGRSIATVKSGKTGAHFTYRVVAADDGAAFFVSVLNGPSNTSDFKYIGLIGRRGDFIATRKSPSPDASSFKVFAWMWAHLNAGHGLGSSEVHHDGKCGRCRRTLTVPMSLELGLGPVCVNKD